MALALGLPACSDCRPSPPPRATIPPALPVTASAAPTPSASSAAPASSPQPAQGAAEDGCDVTVQYDVPRENVAGWVALWKKLSSEAPAGLHESDPPAPLNAAAIRDLLGVKACTPACVVIWPPTFPAKTAHVVVPLPNHTIDCYGPVLENELGGQCSGQMSGSIDGERPLHASVTVEESSSERLCRNDAGDMVDEQEGMEDCMSSCVSRSYREVDFYLGVSGSSALIARQGSRARNATREHIPSIQRKGDALIVRGVNGCTRWIDLKLSPRPAP